ncbi:MAG: hypothetical protein JG774_1912 [Desulfomicrobiaceae bacterium]|jgi:ABC-type Mn2+/Zn2+ transport system permease subunit|nr:DUF3568 family protein [Desulfomicrobiaceae bacterium]MBZ4648097.1 hypothetical protein [Desulfomicrobiaceae bacterium]MBZ4686167.1 hypothetical protein [Desulfomicrobiaceae bacterium]
MRSWILIPALALALACSGCAAVIVGGAAAAGTYVYMAGWLHQTYNHGLDTVYTAARSGPAALGLTLKSTEKQTGKASLQFLDGDTTVWISLEATSSYTTKVSVRWGILGDEVTSRRIMDAIGARL